MDTLKNGSNFARDAVAVEARTNGSRDFGTTYEWQHTVMTGQRGNAFDLAMWMFIDHHTGSRSGFTQTWSYLLLRKV